MRASGTILATVGALAAAAQASGFALPPYLNHNDLYHLIQIVAMLPFYQGGKRLRTFRPACDRGQRRSGLEA
jgi:Family of unknown function (DUF6962)